MTARTHVVDDVQVAAGDVARARLVATLPVTDSRLDIAGVSTAVLEGGHGPPVVLLHGPGEYAAGAARIIPELTRTHRVIAPDLPGHGASTAPDRPLDGAQVFAWLDELIDATCPSPPAVVGRVAGGAIAASFAADHGRRLDRLVLVDTFGLAELRPTARFELVLTRFLAQPGDHTYDRLMAECLFDVDRVRDEVGELWEPLAAYAIDRARSPGVQAAVGALIGEFGIAPIPPATLERIPVPVTLIWGRHDLATPLEVAEAASARYGWPLQVIEDTGDDPSLDQPDAYLSALHAALGDT
ncbi:MAG: alpha/beta fold hydrolase [Acidimicrobiales bacterium]